MTTYTSPNFDSRDGQEIDMLVLHYTGMKAAREALERLCDPAAKVSAHYVVEEDGTIHNLVDEKNRAWHAGVSSWRGHTNINQRSIGIEIVNPGHEFGYPDFPKIQMQSVAKLCKEILSRHPIPARNVVGHSDVAPGRKNDPGEKFDWKFLAENGVGIFLAGKDTATQERLADYGYNIDNIKNAITAFQQHFSQNNVSGQWDNECAGRLKALLDSKL